MSRPAVRPFPSHPRIRATVHAITVLAALAVAACGGGGDGTPATASTQRTPPATSTPDVPAGPAPLLINGLDQACTGAGCGASSGSAYGGVGAGVWARANTSGGAADVQYSISGLTGQAISLLLTNTSGQSQLMPVVSLSGARASASSNAGTIDASVTGLSPQSLTADADAERARREIGEFNRTGWTQAAGVPTASSALRQPQNVPTPPPLMTMHTGDHKSWYHTDGTQRAATLIRQVSTGDHVTVNLWVEDTEYGGGMVGSGTVDALASAFAGSGGIYDMLTGIGGPLWGPNTYSGTMLGTGQPIDIVILNFNRDGAAYGTIGYFWGLHNLKKSADPRSNESISLYLDSETLYLGGPSAMKSMTMTMAHEGTHMQNFYRRAVSMGAAYAYDTWLEEMTAMMMEDFLSFRVDNTYNAIRDVRFRDYVSLGSYNCNLLQFTGFGATCESYSVSGSFGGFLDRQLGLSFFADLLARGTASDSRSVLDQAIRAARPSSGFDQELLRWTVTSNTMMPAAVAPEGYGYPARVDGGFTLPRIDPVNYLAQRRLPTVAPALLQAYGSFPFRRDAVNGVYSDKISVPNGGTLSVVVY